MGLGKTITMIALVLTSPRSSSIKIVYIKIYQLDSSMGGTLIVCPPSVVSTWQDQLITHVDPKNPLRIYLFHGPQRKTDPEFLASFEVVLTTYSTLGIFDY